MHQINIDLTEFYYDLFGKSQPHARVDWAVFEEGQILSTKEQANLVLGVTREEIKEAIFSIGSDKAPGPDGFPARCFTKNWSTVGEDVMVAVEELFGKGLLYFELNHTSVTLIPKNSHEPTIRMWGS